MNHTVIISNSTRRHPPPHLISTQPVKEFHCFIRECGHTKKSFYSSKVLCTIGQQSAYCATSDHMSNHISGFRLIREAANRKPANEVIYYTVASKMNRKILQLGNLALVFTFIFFLMANHVEAGCAKKGE